MDGNFRRVDGDFRFKLRGFKFKNRPALFDLVVQPFELDVQRTKKVTNLVDLLPYLFKLIFHSDISLTLILRHHLPKS